MLYAQVGETRERAEPKREAVCPLCHIRVIPKCGEIVTWHWAHESVQECDTWSEGESQWHLGWKALVSPDACEVVRGPHRADIVLADGTVLELQHSPISPGVIREREAFYGRMLWLIDASDWADHLDIRPGKNDIGTPYVTFRWRHPRRTWFESRRRVFLDFGPTALGELAELLELKKVYHDGPVGGWGHPWTRARFIAEILGDMALGSTAATWAIDAKLGETPEAHVLCTRCGAEPRWDGYQWGTACFLLADEDYARPRRAQVERRP